MLDDLVRMAGGVFTDRLVDEGLATYGPAIDRRTKNVCITEKGRELLEKLAPKHLRRALVATPEGRLLGVFSTDDVPGTP